MIFEILFFLVYLPIAGVTAKILDLYNGHDSEPFLCFIAGAFWPVTLPLTISWVGAEKALQYINDTRAIRQHRLEEKRREEEARLEEVDQLLEEW